MSTVTVTSNAFAADERPVEMAATTTTTTTTRFNDHENVEENR